ncbi:MAG TPA: heme ABC transporter permease [Coxiellaceae bacterium]|nr:heme ABC transporter permease [Coxiellaceae bacterium]
MFNWIHRLGSAAVCYRLASRLIPWMAILTTGLIIYGVIGALYLSPPDYQQGEGFRIIFVHVPSAMLSLGIYFYISVCAIIFLVWKIKVADALIAVSLPLGALFTLITLVTGSLWGKPMWGTYWIWDARLTSELILLFIYGGIIALRNALPTPKTAAKAGAFLILIGLVDLPVIHYSVSWWNTLHQGSTLLKFSRPSIAPAMLQPLLVMIGAFFSYSMLYVCIALRGELLKREKDTHWVQNINSLD